MRKANDILKLHVFMQHEKESGWYVVTCPALPGCVSQGRTKEEALANIKEAAIGWLEVEDEKAIAQAKRAGIEGKKLAVAI